MSKGDKKIDSNILRTEKLSDMIIALWLDDSYLEFDILFFDIVMSSSFGIFLDLSIPFS